MLVWLPCIMTLWFGLGGCWADWLQLLGVPALPSSIRPPRTISASAIGLRGVEGPPVLSTRSMFEQRKRQRHRRDKIGGLSSEVPSDSQHGMHGSCFLIAVQLTSTEMPLCLARKWVSLLCSPEDVTHCLPLLRPPLPDTNHRTRLHFSQELAAMPAEWDPSPCEPPEANSLRGNTSQV